MKRRLNIFCIITLLILFASAAFRIVSALPAFMAGFNAGMSQAAYQLGQNNNGKKTGADPNVATAVRYFEEFDRSADMQFSPKDLNHPVSVKNEITGKTTHAWIMRAQVSYGGKEHGSVLMKSFLLEIPAGIAFVWAFVLFIMLIYRINKSNNVFCWVNVRRLRWIGILMLVYATLITVSQIIDASIAAGQVSLEGYATDYSSCIEFSSLLLGVVTLVMAEIFAVGLKLQEEQELTI